MTRFGLIVSLLAVVASPVSSQDDAQRILSIGGAVTEIVHALGQEDRLVGRDTTSTYPPAVMALPDVGYMRALSAEGVLSVGADLILATEGAGPPEVMDVLHAASIPVVTVPETASAQGITDKIMAIGTALGVPDKAKMLAAEVQADMTAAAEQTAQVAPEDRKKVLFILSLAGGRVMAGGENSGADAIITLAGGVNAAQGFDGYKPMSDEAVLAAQPDVILMMDRGGDHAITDEVVLSTPALASSPAAKNNAVVRMNGLLLLGFGPRTAGAIRDLNTRLYGP